MPLSFHDHTCAQKNRQIRESLFSLPRFDEIFNSNEAKKSSYLIKKSKLFATEIRDNNQPVFTEGVKSDLTLK